MSSNLFKWFFTNEFVNVSFLWCNLEIQFCMVLIFWGGSFWYKCEALKLWDPILHAILWFFSNVTLFCMVLSFELQDPILYGSNFEVVISVFYAWNKKNDINKWNT
jgi:hypothetical protein